MFLRKARILQTAAKQKMLQMTRLKSLLMNRNRKNLSRTKLNRRRKIRTGRQRQMMQTAASR